MERRLGKGLGSLLGEPPREAGPTEIPLGEIRPNPHQPRKHVDSTRLAELRSSIERHGVLQPVVVRRRADHYELILGERRWRASRLAGRTTIPAIVREDVADERMLELALVENVQRADLDPIERAHAFRDLVEALDLTQDQVAERVGLDRSTVSNHLRLLELPDKVQDAVSEGLVSMGHARALLGLSSRGSMLKLLERAVRKGLSVREVERAVRSETKFEEGQSRNGGSARRPSWEVDLEERMRRYLGSKVTLRVGKGSRGTVAIDFHDRKELDRLCELLAPKDLL